MQVELEPIDDELLELAELTVQLARSLEDVTISGQLLAIAEQVRAMAYTPVEGE